MSGSKQFGFGFSVGLLFAVGALQAQEPVLNIQAPATAPVVSAEVMAPVPLPAVTNVPVPHAVTNASAHTTTNGAAHAVRNGSGHAVTNGVVHPATNAVVLPVPHTVVVAPTNIMAAPVPEVVVIPEDEEFFVDTWKDPSYVVGTRMLQAKLKDTTRGTPNNGSFFGTITEITEIDDNSPDKVFLQARLLRSPIWVGVSYDHVSARTMDDSNGDGVPDAGGTDGDEEIKGYIPYLQAAWDNKTRFTPYVQVGYAFFQAKFSPNANWSDNGSRKVESKGSVNGFELGGGLGVRIYKNLCADFFAHTVKVDDITGTWHGHGASGGPFVMTMSYTAYGAGLSCKF